MPLPLLFLALLVPQTPKPGSIAGTVTNAATGAPVRKARITLRAPNLTYTAVSDAAGHFAIPEVTPASFSALVECSGYEPAQRFEPVRVAEEQAVNNLAFSLTPHGVIAGKVIDENGEPMVQMLVTAQSEIFGRNGRAMAIAGMVQTDDRGVYRFFDLPAGRYFLVASDPGLKGSPNGRLHGPANETAHVVAWFPGVPEASQSAAQTLAPGAELSGIDIRMRRMRVYHIRGKVIPPAGQQRVDAPVMLAPCENSGGQGFYAPVLRDGSFDATDIVPGVWCASIIQTADNAHGLYGRQTVTVTDRDVDNVVLAVSPTAEVRGQILVDGEAPSKLGPAAVQLEPLENPGRSANAQIRPDGSFTLGNVQPGPYRVMLNLPFLYLKSARVNGQDSPGERITVPAAGGTLTLAMAGDGGEIGGTVQGTAMVVTAVSAGFATSSGISAGGAFRLANLPPGDYRVLAFETRQIELAQYGEFRKQFDSRAASVTVPPHGRETVTVTAIPAAEVEAAKARLR